MTVVVGGIPCPCGRRGCFEQYASASALIRDTKRAMFEHKNSALWELTGGNPELVDGKTAFEAARAGDACAQQVVKNYVLYLSEGLVLIRFENVEMNTSYRYTTETGLSVDYTPEETSDPTEEISDAIMDEYRNHYGVWIRLNMTQEDVPFDMSADMDDLSEDEMVDMLVFSAMYGVSVSLVTGLVQVDEMNDMFYTDIERLLSLGEECYDTVGGLKLLNDTGRDSVSLSNMTNGLRFAFDLSDEEAPAIICHDDSSFLIDGDVETDEVIGGIIEALGYNYSYEQTIRFRYIGNTVINAPAEGEYPTLYDVFGDKIKEIVYDMWQETQGE